MKNLYWLEEIKLQNRPEVGEKAFALSQIKQHGYPVINGFVIAASKLWEFLSTFSANSLSFDFPNSSLHIDIDNYKALQKVAQEIRQEIMSATFPSEWVGEILSAAETFNYSTLILRASISVPSHLQINTTGLIPSYVSNLPSLSEAIKQIWAELFSAKNIFYWQRLCIGIEKVNLAILVQPLAEAIAAGKVEVTPQYFNLQATIGLGNSIVTGEVQPDFYQINRFSGLVETQQLGNKLIAYRLTKNTFLDLESYLVTESDPTKYILDNLAVKKIIELTERLVVNYKNINLIEWLKTEQGEFYLTQVNTRSNLEVKSNYASPILKGLPASSGQIIAVPEVITSPNTNLNLIDSGKILVAKTIEPNWFPLLTKAGGLITEQGGITCHAAIIARELGIPAIVGVNKATEILKTGEYILVNGDTGEIYRQWNSDNIELERKTINQSINWPIIATKLLVNLSQVNSIKQAAALPVDGIGLLRGEFMLLNIPSLNIKKSLLLEKLTELISFFASAFAPRPIFYRAADWYYPELKNTAKKSRISNYLLNPELFDLELKALKKVNEIYKNINLILPFVRSVKEFSYCRDRVEKAGLTHDNNFQLWIMAEVPSVLFLMPEYIAAGVQGIAIGTNDLTELLLGVSREGINNPELNASHPVMLKAIKQLIDLAKSGGIPCCVCGQAAVDYPELVDKLIEWGITSISVEPDAVEKTMFHIARAEKRLLLEASRFKG